MPTFPYAASYSTPVKRPFSITAIRFGDGYEQRVPTGINNAPMVFSVKFSKRTTDVLRGIDSFLTAMHGVIPFEWNPPPPHNYADAPLYSAIVPYPVVGSVVKDTDNNVFTNTEALLAGVLLTDARWTFLARLPLKFTCAETGWAYDEFNTNSINAEFVQVFEP